MTDNQFREMMDKVTKCVNGIQILRDDVTELKTDVAELKTDVAELKTDVAELKTDVAELKTDVAELKTDVAELKQGQIRIEKRMDNFEEGQAEMKKELQITNRALSILADDSIKTRARVEILEEEKNLSN